ncbi:aminoglycoside phosphotransferase family protein [Paenibacillus sp. N1-5-1-14]|uniref:aminoglycoside phosphotransferase family protein n=1 Tax=Paenibacillus radicibacter TaxID=2972488 RepID=UPI0021592017|nr:aminoglycoside phosphotransferase family protein [Paenibacillus radicibacter]MCR8642909.1 aminoglycoside phosphotransferase family protein [Paenibacillus radicibacter]
MTSPIHDYEHFRNSIPLLSPSIKIERIHKGYSSDEKYIIYNSEGTAQYVFRTYSMDQDANKRLEYNNLQLMEQYDVRCSKPIEIGVLPEQKLGYMIVSFVEGNEASEELPVLTEEQQFKIGVQSGLELKKITRIIAPDSIKPWDERVIAKHQRYRVEYAKCGVTIHHNDKLLSFIDRNLHLVQNRPNLFQHDDFHVSNLIVRNGNLSGIIDFNRSDWGDPIHEFVKVGMFSSEVSIPFSVGQIQGFNDHTKPSEEFWQLYSLYLAMTLISSVVWILKVKPDELDDILLKIHRVMDDHDNFELIVPKWYSDYAIYS